MSPILLIGLVGGLSLVLTAGLTPVVRSASLAAGIVRQIQADRWHRRPTPAIGGVAIFLGFGLSMGLAYVVDPNATQGLSRASSSALLPWSPWEGLVAAVTIAFLVGLVDDFLRLRPLFKLIGQVSAALVLLLSGYGLQLTGNYAVDAAISLFWFVGITNALNLLDNMDGVATGVAAIAAAYLALIFGLEGQLDLMLLAVALCASLLGFLAHNYPPARIFMGDSGSLFIGLSLAGLALAPAPGGSRSLAAVMAAPVLILGVPILDTTLVTIGRLLEGRPVSVGGRDHTSHRFVDLGVSERHIAWLLWGLAATGGGLGVLLRSAERGTALLLGGVLVVVLSLTGAYLLSVRFRALDNARSDGLPVYRWLVESQARYPILAILLDGVLIVLAYYGAYLIRWDPGELPAQLPYFQRTVVVLVGVKLLALVLSGIYDMRWTSFGLYDGLRMARGNLFATVMTVGAFLLIERVGLSRGVVAIDFLVCTILTTGGRLSFRMIRGTTRHWAEDRTPVVILAAEDRAKAAVSQLDLISDPALRAVAIACPSVPVARARVGVIPFYGGQAALRHAVDETGASGVLLIGHDPDEEESLRQHLETRGGLDVYRLDVSLHSVKDGAD